MAGIFGSVRPRSKSLLTVSIITSAVVLLSVASLYAMIFVLYGRQNRPTLQPGIATYLAIAIISIETVAAFIARRKEQENVNPDQRLSRS